MRRLVVVVLTVLLGAAGALVAPTASADPSPQGRANAKGYYLALGDSLAAGYQPGVGDDRAGGYVGQVLTAVQRSAPKTALVNLACSGETTVTMLEGGRCTYAAGSQLAAARDFLHAHGQFVRVVTIDIGANDITRCAAGGSLDQACFVRAMGTVHANARAILAQLRALAPHASIVVLTYYNPFLAAWLTGSSGQVLARTTTGGLQAFNAGLVAAATSVGGVGADVAGAFSSTVWTLVPFVGGMQVPLNVARICQWTWMCTLSDIHTNDTGYAVLATAVIATLDAMEPLTAG